MSIEVKNVTYIYNKGSTTETKALSDISLRIEDGEFVGLIGPTGSGKSTLIQHLNGLLKPTFGQVIVDGQDIWEKPKAKRSLRQEVGLVFQYPEQQIFEETIFEDIAFGPKNLGLDEETVKRRVVEACEMVGLDRGLLERSPFDLSGGQLRRVALAGVLSMKPKTLILDEPAAGLDPKGRDDILSHVRAMHNLGLTVVLVSHNMEDVSKLCDRLLVLDGGKIVGDEKPWVLFSEADFLKSHGLKPPQTIALLGELKKRGWDVEVAVRNDDEAFSEILKGLGMESEAAAL